MLTIHHLDNSRSERIVWLLEELGLPYQQQTFMRDKGLAPAAMKAVHPLGKAPILSDDDVVIMESGAIVEYIVNRYGNGRLAPAVASPEYPLYLQWVHTAEGSMMADLLAEVRVRRLTGPEGADKPAVQMLVERNTNMLKYIDSVLAQTPYLAGREFSAADIMMEFNFSFMDRLPKIDITPYPHVIAWLQRVRARPAYQRMVAVAAPKVSF